MTVAAAPNPAAAKKPVGGPRPAVDTPEPPGARVEVVSPEGVPLVFHASRAGDRVAALLLDGVILAIATGLLVLFVVLAAGSGYAAAVALLAFFLVRYAYFTAFELGAKGATPGKRAVGLRVVDARGGALTSEAVIVRNLTRELEGLLPILVITFPQAAGIEASGWVRLAATMWAMLFLLFPLSNPRRLRVGDLLAGTMVVRVPKVLLLADLGRRAAPAKTDAAPTAPEYAFTTAQLDVYGEYELRVLEDVVRRAAAGSPLAPETAIASVAERIAKKIGWSPVPRSAEALGFLRAYYAALRGRLEHRMLLGRRKADKHAR